MVCINHKWLKKKKASDQLCKNKKTKKQNTLEPSIQRRGKYSCTSRTNEQFENQKGKTLPSNTTWKDTCLKTSMPALHDHLRWSFRCKPVGRIVLNIQLLPNWHARWNDSHIPTYIFTLPSGKQPLQSVWKGDGGEVTVHASHGSRRIRFFSLPISR